MSDINIKKITKLAKIKTSEEENINLKNQLEKIIDWIDILSEAKTDNIDILNNVHCQNLSLFDDNIKMEEDIKQVMSNTNHKYNYFTVPKVIK